jgi:hypothetical protein
MAAAFERSFEPRAKGSPFDAALTEEMDMQRTLKPSPDPLKIAKRPGFPLKKARFTAGFVYHLDNGLALDSCR